MISTLLLCAIVAWLLVLPLRQRDRRVWAALCAASASAAGTAAVADPTSLWVPLAFVLGGGLSAASSGNPGPRWTSAFGNGRGLGKGSGATECGLPAASRWIDPARRLQLERAIYAAEAPGHAEIGVAVLNRCDPYLSARWGFALAVAACALLGLAQLEPRVPVWALLLSHAATLGIAFAATRWPPLLRLLLSRRAAADAVEARARRAFFEAGLHHAPAGAAALLFVAVLERRFVVLADDGGSPGSEPGAGWNEIVASLALAFREGRGVEGLEEAVAACGRALAGGGDGHRDYALLKASVVLEDGWAR